MAVGIITSDLIYWPSEAKENCTRAAGHFKNECKSIFHADGHKLEGVPPGSKANGSGVQNLESDESPEDIPLKCLFELNPLYEIDDEEDDTFNEGSPTFNEGSPEDHVIESEKQGGAPSP